MGWLTVQVSEQGNQLDLMSATAQQRMILKNSVVVSYLPIF